MQALVAEEAAAAVVEVDLAAWRRELAERTADVQRVHAEYANYRKRVDRDRELVRDQATAAVLAELLTVLDDIDRAREHDELTGGFKSVAEAIEATVDKLGLEKYGTAGEPFDPTVHEALHPLRGRLGHRDHLRRGAPAGLPVRRPGAPSGPGRRRRPARLTQERRTHPNLATSALILERR